MGHRLGVVVMADSVIERARKILELHNSLCGSVRECPDADSPILSKALVEAVDSLERIRDMKVGTYNTQTELVFELRNMARTLIKKLEEEK